MPRLEILLAKFENIKIVDDSIPYSQYTPIDLSVNNSELSQIDLNNLSEFDSFIENHLQKSNAKIAYGGYNEVRNLYQSSPIFNDKQVDERNIHIGMDFWIKAGTRVLAALDGTVYGFNNNTGAGNYGPTIILKHSLENEICYTLYGHLSPESIQNIEINAFFKQGQQLATLGDSLVNGGYSPHLHFQIIQNMDGNSSDYPGVCSHKNLEYYLENCPNPNVLLKIP